MTSPSPDLAILRHLADCTCATAAEIGIAYRMTANEVRVLLVALESRRLVIGWQDSRLVPAARVFAISSEGRRMVEHP